MILADTSVWVPYANRRWDLPAVAALRASLHNGEIAITGMVLAEVLQGIRRNEGPELEELLVSLPFLPDDKNAWHEAGRLANSLERSGLRTPLSDVVVGIVARTHDCELLARDNHFHRIPGLRLHEASSHT